jgi:hypothetical protein
MGLRDPRRSSFDRIDRRPRIGDVGQDSYEEVNRIPSGVSALNFRLVAHGRRPLPQPARLRPDCL